MKQFIQNITNTYGQKGKDWLHALPALITELSAYWDLSNIIPVDNMSYHYVAKAVASGKKAVVFKIGCDEKTINAEKIALEYFRGQAAIRLLDYHLNANALLLEQAVPGTTLKSHYPNKIDYVIDHYSEVIKRLHHKPLTDHRSYRNVREWLNALDQASTHYFPNNLLGKAIDLKNKLLNSQGKLFFLHGDLHHENILQHGKDWLIIDPKGIVGELEFEVAAFDIINKNEIDCSNVKILFNERAENIAKKLNMNSQRLKEWMFVRSVLSAAWSIEDNDDPSLAIQLAQIFDR